jgi:hypothetical protein
LKRSWKRAESDENHHLGLTRNGDIHCSNGAALGAGVNAMKVNRETEPKVYKRIGIRTQFLGEQSERADQLTDIAIGILGFWLLVVIFVVAG